MLLWEWWNFSSRRSKDIGPSTFNYLFNYLLLLLEWSLLLNMWYDLCLLISILSSVLCGCSFTTDYRTLGFRGSLEIDPVIKGEHEVRHSIGYNYKIKDEYSPFIWTYHVELVRSVMLMWPDECVSRWAMRILSTMRSWSVGQAELTERMPHSLRGSVDVWGSILSHSPNHAELTGMIRIY